MMSIIVTVQINPWIAYKLTMDRLHLYTKLHKTSYKTVPSQHGLPPRVFAQLKVCSFKGRNFVIAYTDGFDTPVSCDKRLTYFMERLIIALV